VPKSVAAQENPAESGDKVSVHARTRHGNIIITRVAT
jgi:hypothetical protein